MCLAFHSHIVDKTIDNIYHTLSMIKPMLKQCRDSLIMLKTYLRIMQAWRCWAFAYCSAMPDYLLLCLIDRLHSLFIPQFVSFGTILTLGIEIEK